MKLSEALILRSDCQKRVEQLRQRLVRSANVQEGELPPEDPQSLMAELERTIAELQTLIQRINQTNSRTILREGVTVSDALAERDTLLLKRGVYESLVQAATYNNSRYSRSEIKTISTVDVAALQTQLDRLSRDCRELDTRIQEINWTTELLE